MALALPGIDESRLRQMLSEEEATTSGDPVETAMVRMFQRDKVPRLKMNPDGSIE